MTTITTTIMMMMAVINADEYVEEIDKSIISCNMETIANLIERTNLWFHL